MVEVLGFLSRPKLLLYSGAKSVKEDNMVSLYSLKTTSEFATEEEEYEVGQEEE